jgi:NCS2 family nucleobase:cation symporter-2
MIGFSLLKVGFMYAGGGGWLMNNKPEIFANANHLTVAFTVFIVAIGFNIKGKGMASSASILIGIVAGFIVAMSLGMVNYGKIDLHHGLHFQCLFNMELILFQVQ